MFKANFKKISFLLVFLSLLISTSYAESVKKTIDVYYDSIKIFVNNSLINPKDGNGNPVEPFIYNGTTYLPVRALSEALDKEVTWDESTKSIYISDNKRTIWLNDLEYLKLQSDSSLNEWKKLKNKNFTDSTGNLYSRVTQYDIYYGWMATDYSINKKYNRISGKFALSIESKDTTYAANLKLYGDNKLLYTSPELTGGVLPIEFDVDISGVETLRIEVSNNSPFGISYVNYGLIDVVLSK